MSVSKFQLIKRVMSGLAVTVALGGCDCHVEEPCCGESNNTHIEHHFDPPTQSSNTTSTPPDSFSQTLASGETLTLYQCKDVPLTFGTDCQNAEAPQWQSDCKGGSCNLVKVRVFYMLTEDLGANQRIIVEAYDNATFSEKPIATATLNRFNASKPGMFSDVDLLLSPGKYFLRAHIDRSKSGESPYQYSGMNLVSESPVGLYGALSDAEEIAVTNSVTTKLHNIYLDKLFKKPEAEVPTRAFVRLLINGNNLGEIPLGRQLLVQLFDKDDFNFEPIYSFPIASENLRVEGRDGFTEFVTPELKDGRYFMRVFLDKDGNGYFDDSDPEYTYRMYGETARIRVIKQRTETIECKLELPFGESEVESEGAEEAQPEG